MLIKLRGWFRVFHPLHFCFFLRELDLHLNTPTTLTPLSAAPDWSYRFVKVKLVPAGDDSLRYYMQTYGYWIEW
jgi:hypothetical protein